MRCAVDLKVGDEVIGLGTLLSVHPHHSGLATLVSTDHFGTSLLPSAALIPVLLPEPKQWRRTISYVTENERTANAWIADVGVTEPTTSLGRVSTRTFGPVEVLNA